MQIDSTVITGVGLVTSLGISAEEIWKNVLSMKPGLGPMPALETPAPDEKGGYQASDLPGEFSPDLPREVRYLRWTIQQALVSSQLTDAFPYDPARCGYVLGTTLHGMRGGGQFLRTGDFNHLKTFLAGNVLQLAIEGFPLRGDAITTCSACSSSLGSIALAVTLLETNQLDLVIAGGYDAVSEYAYGGFNALRLVADGPLRSFARDRQGMKLGEGYGVVVLERASDANRRHAKILATIAGCGESADAHHLTQPDPNGRGAAAAISAALSNAELQTTQINLIAAHATGTADNDAGEHAALTAVFGDHLSKVPVTAFKTHVGHTLGGAGAVELILSMLALRDQTVPACANVTAADVDFTGLTIAADARKPAGITSTLNTSLGFGGANTCVILSSSPREKKSQTAAREVCISGIGIVVPNAIGIEAFRQLIKNSPLLTRDTGAIDESLYSHLLNARRVRRLSTYVKLSLAATALACSDAGFNEQSPLPSDCSVLLGSTHGSASYCVDYYRQIVEGGYIAANPLLFAEGVPNAAAAHLSLMLGIKGACQTVIGSRTAGLDALRLASLRIASGQWERAIVGAAEEYLPLINDGYRNCGLYSGNFSGEGFATGSGAVTLVLESREALRDRGGTCRGIVGSGASIQLGADDAIENLAMLIGKMSGAKTIFGSSNHTWIDRAEALACRKSGFSSPENLYGHVPELYSVGPLAAVSAALLSESDDSSGVLCTGFDRVASAICVSACRDLVRHHT